MTPGPGIERGTHWWNASALTTAPASLPMYFKYYSSPGVVSSLMHEHKSVPTEFVSRECLLFAGQTLLLETVNEPSMRHFWETLTTSVTARESGGHVDIFVPLVETGKEVNKLRVERKSSTIICVISPDQTDSQVAAIWNCVLETWTRNFTHKNTQHAKKKTFQGYGLSTTWPMSRIPLANRLL